MSFNIVIYLIISFTNLIGMSNSNYISNVNNNNNNDIDFNFILTNSKFLEIITDNNNKKISDDFFKVIIEKCGHLIFNYKDGINLSLIITEIIDINITNVQLDIYIKCLTILLDILNKHNNIESYVKFDNYEEYNEDVKNNFIKILEKIDNLDKLPAYYTEEKLNILKNSDDINDKKDLQEINNIIFSIYEYPKNNKFKEYKYTGIRETLQKPIHINHNNKEITYKYRNIIKKVPK